MFLNEKVNDFDIYLKDVNVLEKLVKYYTKDVPGIIIMEESKKEKLLKQASKFVDIPSEPLSAYIIALSSLKQGQIKLFFEKDAAKGGIKLERKNQENGFQLISYIPTYEPIFLSPNAITLSDDIQIVTRFTGNSKTIHETFDYMHATNYFTFEEGLVTNIDAVESLLSKQLKYQGSQYPITSIIRMKKFINRGWKISAGEILKMTFQVSELDLKNPVILEDQLIGVDVAYFGLLIEILRGVNPGKITSAYLNKIIDKVFNDEENVFRLNDY